jgi:hypothetical protein
MVGMTSSLAEWQNVAYAASFEVQVSDTPTFSHLPPTPVILPNTPPVQAVFLTGIPFFPAPSPTQQLYYMRVRALNSDGAAGKWSAVHSFTFDVTAPDAPIPLSPANGGSVTNPQLSLTWSSVADAAGYNLWFSAGNINNDQPTRLGKVTSYKLPVTIAEGTVYYWEVQAYDAAGNKSNWPATPWSFSMLAGLSLPKTPTVVPSMTATPIPSATLIATPVEPDVSATPLPQPSATPTAAAPTDQPSPTDVSPTEQAPTP